MPRSPILLLALALVACDANRTTGGASSVIQPTPDHAAEGSPRAASPPGEGRADQPAMTNHAASHAVLAELFTSEGCSSCPPADDVLAALDRDLAPHGLITLSFHVDYWNELGWPDPFSDPRFTSRQRAYADSFGERGVYTPELVIDGRQGFVGSNAGRARDVIRDRLEAGSIPIHLEATRESPTSIRVRWSIPAAPPGTRLYLAAVEPSATTRVPRGENAGRTLRHVNVVRALESAAASESEGDRLLTASGAASLQAVAFLQARDLTILGAAQVGPGD